MNKFNIGDSVWAIDRSIKEIAITNCTVFGYVHYPETNREIYILGYGASPYHLSAKAKDVFATESELKAALLPLPAK